MSYQIFNTLFAALEAVPPKLEPPREEEIALPYDFPSKDQLIIEKARKVIEDRHRARDAAWSPIINNWPAQ